MAMLVRLSAEHGGAAAGTRSCATPARSSQIRSRASRKRASARAAGAPELAQTIGRSGASTVGLTRDGGGRGGTTEHTKKQMNRQRGVCGQSGLASQGSL